MTGMRSDRARARASHLLATVYPIPHDVEIQRLRELAMDYIAEADRLEAENRGRVVESDEVISSALDAVARDYFKRVVLRAVSRNKARHASPRREAVRLMRGAYLQLEDFDPQLEIPLSPLAAARLP